MSLPADGDYLVHATSAYPDQIGSYNLTLNNAARVEEIPGVASDIIFDGINFGRNTSRWANDDECDDPRFQGSGVASGNRPEDSKADATDCLNAYRAGRAQLR